ncbi:DUF1127 domain-containing protein [Inquilinus sp.]|jgi:uncharacterized protein YjiS (DUF1127 family)|uniref:DUF1127 domain-containing protein n=1 Tax=Inquilinus sp. TaxID=1932117 RepID=UPI003784DE73
MAKVSAYIGSCKATHTAPRTSLDAAREEGNAEVNLINKLVAAWERRRAYAALMQLDDRLLADIGMNRGTIMERLTRAGHDIRIDTVAVLRPTVAAANEDSVIRRAA